MSLRLQSTPMFERSEESNQIQPKRVIVLSVEGNVTEKDYFELVQKYKASLGIHALVYIEVLSRHRDDTKSAPKYVLELMEEYFNIRTFDESHALPEEMQSALTEGQFDSFFLKQYYDHPETIDEPRKSEFEQKMMLVGIDISYRQYLRNCQGSDGNDVFGIVIDRDYHSTSEQQLREIYDHCNEKGIHCYITNPCFEFWLLLHLSDVKHEYIGKEKQLLENKKDQPGKRTYVGGEVHRLAHHDKHISESTFIKHYLPAVNIALLRAKDFASTKEELLTKLGSNLTELFEQLRES